MNLRTGAHYLVNGYSLKRPHWTLKRLSLAPGTDTAKFANQDDRRLMIEIQDATNDWYADGTVIKVADLLADDWEIDE